MQITAAGRRHGVQGIQQSNMTEQELNDWGTSQGLDVTERIYREAGISRSWVDYSLPDSDDPDEAWDQDAYYEDFDRWWKNLPLQEKVRIHYQITSKN